MLLNNKHYYNLPPQERKDLWKHYKKVYPNMGYTDMVKHFNGEVENYQFGGKTNTLEGDLISKVIMNRNKDKDFVKRAYDVGQYPESKMFTLPDPNEFGSRMTHKMSWGEDDKGQAYMFPEVLNPNNEAIKIPNQYADYITSEGYKKVTNIPFKKSNGGLIKKYEDGGTDKPKVNFKILSGLANNIPKNRLEAESREEYKRMHPEIEAANFYNKIQKNINQTSEIYQSGPKKGQPTGKGALEPSYPEMMLMPGSLPIKAASKLGKAAVFAAEALNPVSGFKNMSKQLNKAAKGTSSVVKEIKGELTQGKANRESIKQGNEWLENWINHPTTQNKIDADIDNKKYFATSFLKNPNQDEELFELIRTQSKNFKPNSKEYTLLKQLDDNLQQYLSKKSRGPIHQGNWGVSYQHSVHPLNRNIIDKGIEKPFDRYGSWISRTTKSPQSKRVSTTIHEGTHDWVSDEAFKKSGMRNIALKDMNSDIKKDFLEWEKHNITGSDPIKTMGKERAYQAYLADPTEQHARIMELRYQLGITPDYKVTPKYAQEVIDWIDKGGSNIDPKFLKVIDKNPNKLAELFNRFWAIPAIVGAGALQQDKKTK